MTMTPTVGAGAPQAAEPGLMAAAGLNAAPGRMLAVSPTASGGDPAMAAFSGLPGMEQIDIYALGTEDLDGVTGISLSGMCDQVYLGRIGGRLEAFVRGGGRLLVNGHVVERFLPGLARWRKLAYKRPADLVIESAAPHPVFAGVDMSEVLFRTGVPGPHTPEELAGVGVAGFYGRGYHVELPEGATVLNTIGQLRAPIDYAYPLGAGSVLVHGGLDLAVFAQTPHTTLPALGTNITAWLGGLA